jgi:hypothetical protein
MRRRSSLDAALRDIDAGRLADVSRIVVSRQWWDGLSAAERDDYQRRCLRHRIELSADDRMSRHFVEVLSGPGEPPLSSEQRI